MRASKKGRLVLTALAVLSPFIWGALGCGARSGLTSPAFDGVDAGVFGLDATSSFDASGRDAPGTEGRDAASTDAPAPDTPSCAPLLLALGRTPPAVVLVLDRSGSMNATFRPPTTYYPAPASRWEILLSNLIGPPRGVVGERERSIRFGAATYSSTPTRCPDLNWAPPALMSHGAIRDLLLEEGPGGGTPTGEAISRVVELLAVEPDGEGGRPVLVLATDGEPNDCLTTRDARAGSIAAVSAAFRAGLRTFVVSVADEIAASHLSDLADAGAGLPLGSGTPYFAGDAPGTLGAALDGAIASAVSCRAELPPHLLGTPCESLSVTLDGRPIACGGVDGFRLAGASTIELLGASCARARSPAARLEIPCP